MYLVTCFVRAIYFGILFSCVVSADVHLKAPMDTDQLPNTDHELVVQLSRRLKHLEDLRAKDELRINQLVNRVTELEDQRKLENLAMIKMVSKLENHRANEIVKITKKMENLAAIQANDVRELTNRLAQTEHWFKMDQSRLTQCASDLKTIQEQFHLLKQTNTTLESSATSYTTDESEAVSSSMESEVTFLNVPRSSPNRSVDRPSSPVVFSVTLHDVMTDPGVGQTVIFNNVLTKLGVKYSLDTGIFTCTKPGVYLFSWSIEVANPGFLSSDLIRNGMTIAETTAKGSDDWGVGSTLVAIELAIGDEVWVRVDGHSPGADIQRWGTSFTGFLLYSS